MEQGRIPDRHLEAGGPEAGDAKPEPDKKRKRSRKGSDYSAALVIPKPRSDSSPVPQEKDKVRKALADFFVEKDTSSGERKKKPGEESSPESESQLTKGAKKETEEEQRGEVVVEAEDATAPHELEPALIGAEDDIELQVHEGGKNADREERMEYELPLNVLNGGEIIIRLQGDVPISERVILDNSEAEHTADEPEAIPLVQAAEVPPLYEVQPEEQQQTADVEAPRGEMPHTEPATERMVPPIENLPDVEPTPEPEEPAVSPIVVRAPEILQRPEPAEAYRMYMEREAQSQPDTVHAPGEEMVTKQSAEDAAYYAERAGKRSGLVTGLFIGVLYEHFKHKRRERKTEKRFKAQGRQLQQVRKDQHFYLDEQSKRQAESQRQLASAENRLASTEKRLEERGRFAEQPNQNHRQDNVEVPERLEVPAEHRLETSAWHTIEVDSRTGKPVEQPTFAYGHEYYQERAHESAPADQRSATAGELAITGASTPSGQGQPGDGPIGGSSTPPTALPNIPSATRQGPPQPTSQSKNLDVRNPFTSTGPIWPYLIALAVIFICLAFLI